LLDFAKTQDEVHLNIVRKFQKFICDPKKFRVPSVKFKAIALVDPLASWLRVGILFVEYCADQDKVGKEVYRRGDKLYSKVLSNELSRIDEWSTKDLKAYEAKVAEIMVRYWKNRDSTILEVAILINGSGSGCRMMDVE